MNNWSKISIAVLALGLVACDDADTDPFQLDDDLVSLSAVLNLDLANPPNYADPLYPPHYGQRTLNNDNAPNDNPVTDEGATLGRVLFYDQNLSINRTISCASCHSQSLGFGDTRRLSVGFAGGETGAHSMRLANASFYEGEVMFWNGRAHDLEDQSLQPVMDGVEMGFDDDAGGVRRVRRTTRRFSSGPSVHARSARLVCAKRSRSTYAALYRPEAGSMTAWRASGPWRGKAEDLRLGVCQGSTPKRTSGCVSSPTRRTVVELGAMRVTSCRRWHSTRTAEATGSI